jgi:hypothetical protein
MNDFCGVPTLRRKRKNPGSYPLFWRIADLGILDFKQLAGRKIIFGTRFWFF